MSGCGASEVGRSATLDRLSLGRAAGVRYPPDVDAGGSGVVSRHQPYSACSCELALRAVGAARGRPRGGGGGGSPVWVWGVRGWALSHALPPVLVRVRPGPATHWLCVGGVWAWGPVTNPTARALASWLCALLGQHEGARGGGGFCPGVGLKQYPEPHDHGGVYNRSPCAH